MKKFDLVKIISFGGVLLTLGANLISNYSQQKEIEKTVAEEVAKALNK